MATTVKASIGSPALLDITSYRNDSIDDFQITITDKSTGLPVDLSVYDVIEIQIKDSSDSDTAIFEFSKLDGSILWKTTGGVETGDGSDGVITLRKTMTEMESLPARKYVWDVQFEITASSKRNTLVKGLWVNEADITR